MNLPEKYLLIDGNQVILRTALNPIAPEVNCAIAFNGHLASKQLHRHLGSFQDFITAVPGIKQLAENLNGFFNSISVLC